MTVDDFIRLVRNPEAVQAENETKLKEITDYYPYFSQAKLLYLKSLQKSDNLLFDSRIAPTALYASHRDSLYYYLYPDKKLSKSKEGHQREERYSGSYFDMLDMVEGEGGERPISLKKIAEQLKASRRMIAAEPEESKKDESLKVKSGKGGKKEVTVKAEKRVEVEKVEKPYIPVPDYFKEEDPTENMSLEEKSKWHIKEKNYEEAIKILKQLYLINPKKSVYFADQIRFLEKILSKTK